jgi:hypothetical protein
MLRPLLVALTLVLAVSSSAAAAPFTGSLTVYVFSTQQAMPAILFGGGSGTSTAGLVTLPGDVFTGTASATTPTSVAPPITGNQVVVTGHDPGSFAGAPLAGAMALHGQLSLYGLGGFTSGGTPLLGVPLVAGAPGAVAFSSGGGVSVTAVGAAWSAGTVAVTLPTSMGGTITTSFAGYDNRVGGVGTLQLVTPIRIDSNVSGASVVWTSLRLTFVPEPATALLLGAGTLGLAAHGRRRAAAARAARHAG